MNDIPTQYAWTCPDDGMANVRLQKGDTVVSFRGEEFTFEGVARKAYGNSSGRVAVSRLCADAYSVSDTARAFDCPHMWHRDGIDREELFPSVFGLYLGYENGEKA